MIKEHEISIDDKRIRTELDDGMRENKIEMRHKNAGNSKVLIKTRRAMEIAKAFLLSKSNNNAENGNDFS